MPLRIVSRLAQGRYISVLQLVAHDLVVHLGVEPTFVEPDAGAAMRTLAKGRSEVDVHLSMPCALRILERDKKSAGARPCCQSPSTYWRNSTIWRNRKLARASDIVGKDGRTRIRAANSIPYRFPDMPALR